MPTQVDTSGGHNKPAMGFERIQLVSNMFSSTIYMLNMLIFSYRKWEYDSPSFEVFHFP